MRWIGAGAAVLTLLVVCGIWRLMQGPIELDWLAPYVEAGLQHSGMGLRIAFSGVRLGIDRTTHQLELQVKDVRLSRPGGGGGALIARFPEMAAGFRLGVLLRGKLEPAQLVIAHPVLYLVRAPSGAISAQIGGGGGGALPSIGPQAIEQLAGPPAPDAPLALLQRISIRGATLFLDDRSSRRTWRADRVDIAIDRSSKGARGDVSFAVPLGDSTPELHASYRFFAARQLLDLDLSIDGVVPTALPPIVPEIAQLRRVEAPVSGTLETRIDLARGVAEGSRLDVSLGTGRLRSEWLPNGSIPVRSGTLRATYAPDRNEVRLDGLHLDLGGGTRLMLTGSFAGVTPALLAAYPNAPPPGLVSAQFAGVATDVPVARFASLWPTAINPRTRTWMIANIRDGVLDKASVNLSLDLDPAALTADMRSDEGQLSYHGLSIAFLSGLPPVRDVSGTAAFARDHLIFTPTSGALKGLRLTGGTVAITDIKQFSSWLTIDLGVVGPLRDALDVLDANPLRYAHAIGLDPRQISGQTETRLHFKLPLIKDLQRNEIDFGATATLSDTALPDLAFDHGITGGNFALVLDRSGARLNGTGSFAAVPAKIDASLAFHAHARPHAVFRIGMTLDAAAQQRLGLDVAAARLSGPIAIDATYSAANPQHGEATAVLDLRDAALAVPEAGWKKPAGQPGTAKIVLDLANQKVAAVRQISITAAGLNGDMTARLASNLSHPDRSHLEAIEIRRLQIGGDVLSGTLTREDDGGRGSYAWQADIQAARADASHLLKEAMQDTPSTDSPALAINARVDRLVFGKARELRQVTAVMRRTGGVWRSGSIAGEFPDDRQLSLQFGAGGGSDLVMQSNDLGDVLQLFDIADNVHGGNLRVAGKLTQIGGGKRVLRAHVDGEHYVVSHAPILARILSLPSLTGLGSALSGSGLPFFSLRGDIEMSGDRIALNRLLAYGESLGITADGWFEPDRDRMQLHGTVAPAYALNSIVGNVPIIGTLLGGGSQGLFAANYQVSASGGGDPQVSVNPLSALAPGILRQLFAPSTSYPDFPEPQGQPQPAAN